MTSNATPWTGITLMGDDGAALVTSNGSLTWREPEAGTNETNIYQNIVFESQLQGGQVMSSDEAAGTNDSFGYVICFEEIVDSQVICHTVAAI